MISTIPRLASCAVCVLSIAGLGACGSSNDSSSTTAASASSTDTTQASASQSSASPGGYGATQSSPPPRPTGATEISVDGSSNLGDILVDSKGNTVYLFEADKGPSSTCNGECAQVWPPVTTEGDPTAGAGANASLLGTSKRDDGTTEVTYAGHPLYYYEGDVNPGDTTGNDVDQFGAEWYALTPKGDTPEDGGAS